MAAGSSEQQWLQSGSSTDSVGMTAVPKSAGGSGMGSPSALAPQWAHEPARGVYPAEAVVCGVVALAIALILDIAVLVLHSAHVF